MEKTTGSGGVHVRGSKTFDECKLTPAQRQALAIAKAQNVPFARRLEDLALDIESDAVDELIETVADNRRKDRQAPPKTYL